MLRDSLPRRLNNFKLPFLKIRSVFKKNYLATSENACAFLKRESLHEAIDCEPRYFALKNGSSNLNPKGQNMMEIEPFLKEFGRMLKKTRKDMGLSQVNAAQNMHIDYRHYQNIEGGKINLRLDTLIKLVKFYNLDKVSRPFNLEACLDLLTGFDGKPSHDNWDAIFHHFVEGGHAGFVIIDCKNRTIDQINDKLFTTLGYRSAQDLIGKPLPNLLVASSANQFEALTQQHIIDKVSAPFIATFRTQPPAFPIPMMAIVRSVPGAAGGNEKLHGIFFDRKTLDEEGYRLKEILSGYQRFMELYPQLKAV